MGKEGLTKTGSFFDLPNVLATYYALGTARGTGLCPHRTAGETDDEK